MANAKAIVSTAASVAASAMLIQSIVNELLPWQLQNFLSSSVKSLSQNFSSEITIIIEEFQGFSMNQVFEAAEIYLGSISNSSAQRLRVGKGENDNKLAVRIDRNEEVFDVFQDEVYLNHPMTFDKLAIDLKLKKTLLQDLDNFMNGKEYYKRVGKAWKRGNLLYGPPGTGKSSLIAAMANHLNFDIYDLDLTAIHNNGQRRQILLDMSSPSIVVIQDIDCSIKLQNRDSEEDDHQPQNNDNNKLIEEVEVTPAEVAGELMKTTDAEISLPSLFKFLHNKKTK
ncbi:AAA-type ATPase [Parasponia andersonii]|uniref:AAA-type ATPase n=1 Tax=Parasponia andersonii TaxID=3476 RepID=A0A2P5DZ40_PARAD|nr:AAA-type ATPase [Parasponia andersonii]